MPTRKDKSHQAYPPQAYQDLLHISKEAATLHGANQILQWDQETYMPSKAAASRAAQIELISRLIHQLRTGLSFRKALSKLIAPSTGRIRVKGLSAPQQAAVKNWYDDFTRLIKLPSSFVEEFARLTSEASEVWRSSREAKSFARFAPYLDRIVSMTRKKADYLGFTHHPYDALVDEYEPNMTRRKLHTLFTSLRQSILPLRNHCLKQPQPDCAFLHGTYSANKQMQFSYELLQALGFDKEKARLDLTAHPFCVAPHPSDGRMTTRINIHSPMNNFLAVLHEGGHYLYESSLPEEHFGSPLCEAVSTAIHESQSRWWETLVGQSLPFWEYYFPKMQKVFPNNLKKISLNHFYQAINAVTMTPIRIHADEISYSLHIILRFELECDLVDGSLAIRDLPDAWNAKMKEYLGITPEDDAEGCLQDIHWSLGYFGYFPTYTLGNLYAAQLFASYTKATPTWKTLIANGEFLPMREWLYENIHRYGSIYPPERLVKRATHHTLTSDAYVKYLNKKYKELY